MHIRFLRIDDRRCASIANRDDGVSVRVPGYGHVEPLPHDFAHFVVERELQLTRGFWGSVAAGAIFPGMEVLSGRRRPHATERSRAIIKASGKLIGQSEVLVGALMHIVERDLDVRPKVALKSLDDAQSAVRAGAYSVDEQTLARLCATLRMFARQWQRTGPGEDLGVLWTFPADAGTTVIAARRRSHGEGHAAPSRSQPGKRAFARR